MVRLEHLSIGYGQTTLMRGLSAQLEAGQLAVVAGRNGSGKSTLLRTVCGLLPALDGKVTLNGEAIGAFTERERAKQLALVLATAPPPTGLRVAEVIALGAWADAIQPDDLKLLNLMKTHMLDGLAERRLNEISDGERQKTMIARALMQDTPLIVMDEPTAFLDLPSRIAWWDGLRHLKSSGKTLVISTHDLEQATRSRLVDQYWVLNKTEARFTTVVQPQTLDQLLALMG